MEDHNQSETAAILEALLEAEIPRFDADGENGMAKLLLSLINLVHQLLEAQALRRSDAGTLDSVQLERLGLALMEQARQIDALCHEFGISPTDLSINLGEFSELH
ncbi:hypothetical protein GCM10011363_44910 [Marivita lacus]|uniref:Gas vesicle protein K n=1 Tax=Marivita lacus TaxID=1323742 RepID=A0ABQ1LHC6_9RHOB|nr:gas vesicle protein K [Marivita lacus]GGC23461.1 hypothetical protein GCM10011363_44910 [Marivita lacus]